MTYYAINRASRQERLARELEDTSHYRVLRPLPTLGDIWLQSMPLATSTTTIGVLDTETTGLDPSQHKIIELALVKMTIDDVTGALVDMTSHVSWLEDPLVPLTPEIERLTGLTDTDLCGQKFDDRVIAAAFDDIDLLVAFNTPFDRAFMVRRFPEIEHPWACAAREIDWAEHGLEGRSMGALIVSAGHRFTAHRAGPDTWALACLLAMKANDKRTIAAHLIDKARTNTQRLYASGAPFGTRDALKSAGYRWAPIERSWWLEADAERIANEAAWLAELHPLIRPQIVEIDWYNRHAG